MGKHDWNFELNSTSPQIQICSKCGISAFRGDCLSKDLPCPPWSSTDLGETTDTNRIREAGEVKEYHYILNQLRLIQDLISDVSLPSIAVDEFIGLKNYVKHLIQKYEEK